MFLDWVENLPDRWKAKPLRSLASYAVSNVNKSVLRDEIPVRLCNYTDVYHNEFIDLGLDFMRATASEHEIEKFGLSVGDIIITKDSETWDDIGVPALVRETADDLVCGYHLAILRPDREIIDGAFLFRCLQAKSVRLQLELSAKGVTRFGLPKSEIGAMTLPVPPLSRQRAIADHLDRETARLDALVAAKERLLELLAEKRQALIDHAVTGSLDPQALSCDAGAATAGEGRACVAGSCEPEHDSQHMWPVKRLRFLTQDGTSIRRRKILTDAEKVTFLPMENIGDQGEIDRSIIRDIDDVRGGYTQFFDGDVLVAKITPCFENGKGALVNGTLSGVGYGTTELHVLAPGDEIDGRFLYYVTASGTFRGLGEAAMYGAAGQKRVPEEFIRNYPVPAPPYAQQRAIADYLDRETARIDGLAARTRDTIALLRERRAALVAAAVTGQIGMELAS